MSDDPTKRDYRDRDRNNIHESYEVEYWTQRLGVTKDQLVAAHKKVGPMVKDIAKELGVTL